MVDLEVLPGDYAVCRLAPGSARPGGLDRNAGVISITWTDEEISIICPSPQAPSVAQVEAPWRCLRVAGPLDHALTGVLAALTNALADARVNIFAFSTFDTDYLLVPGVRLAEAMSALTSAGHRVSG